MAGVKKRLERKLRQAIEALLVKPLVRYPHGRTGMGKVEIGEGCCFSKGVEIDGTGFVKVGDHCIFGRNVQIVSHTHKFLDGVVEDITQEKGILPTSIEIGSNVFIGDFSLILPQVRSIGKDAIIGAGAVLTKNVGPGEIWAGNPAARIGSRYEACKDR